MKIMNLNELETAIVKKFPNVTISEIRKDEDEVNILGIVPAQHELDSDHIVEWDRHGLARECSVNDRSFMEVAWDKEAQKPVYIEAKLLIHNGIFDIAQWK